MQIESLLTLKRTRCSLSATGKRGALELLANTIAEELPELDADDLLRRFQARERLGSTGIGHGIAIPHCRVSNISDAVGALITLTEPVSYESIDSEPVDILFAMLVPDEAHNEHLQNLAALAGALAKSEFRQQLREATDDKSLYQAAVTMR
jgi:nitrogen PTS system EIIA component